MFSTRMSRPKIARRLVLMLGAGTLLLSACGSDSAATQTQSFTLEFVNTATEGKNFVRSIEDDGSSIQYGTLVFEGPGTFVDQKVETEILAYLNYVDGTGPSGGYLTITTVDEDSLVFSLSLTAANKNDRFEISGRADVIGGTGRFADVTGSGSGVGVRNGPVGSDVEWTLTLDLAGLEN